MSRTLKLSGWDQDQEFTATEWRVWPRDERYVFCQVRYPHIVIPEKHWRHKCNYFNVSQLAAEQIWYMLNKKIQYSDNVTQQHFYLLFQTCQRNKVTIICLNLKVNATQQLYFFLIQRSTQHSNYNFPKFKGQRNTAPIKTFLSRHKVMYGINKWQK